MSALGQKPRSFGARALSVQSQDGTLLLSALGQKRAWLRYILIVRFAPENEHSTDSMSPTFQHAVISTSIPAPADAHKRPSAIFVLRKIAGGSGIDHTAVLQHIGAIGDVDRYAHVLFDQQY